jgi:predicted Zn-dependent peptidase
MVHIVEHLLFKGTASRSASDIARGIDRLGGAINAFTEKECMAIHAVVPRDGFFAAAEIIVDFINNAKFEHEEYLRERAVIEDEIQAAEDDPEEFASDAFFRRLWGDHPVARKISGEIEDIRRYDRESAFLYFQKYFQGSPDLISIAGGVSAEEASFAFKDLSFFSARSQNPSAVSASMRNPPPLADPLGTSYVSMSAMQIQAFIAYQSNRSIRGDSYYQLEVANTAFGDSMACRLFQSLREQKGLCYSVFSSPALFCDSTLWTCYATVSPSNSVELLSSMLGELEGLKNHPLSTDEIETAKAHLCGMTRIASQDMEYRMRRIARQALWGNTVLTYEESIERIGAVTASDANGALQSLMANTPILFGVGPRKGAVSFKRETLKLQEAVYA